MAARRGRSPARPGWHPLAVAKPAVQTFGKYQILERIATGGMAEIYKARLEGIGGFQRTFAIKRILPHLSQDAEYVAMLVDEAKVAGLLSHANIVQIVDLGQADGFWYIAMEYVDGADLGAVLERAASKGLCLPVPHAVFITIELLKGLEYAHQRQVMRGGRPVPLQIIHRDISPPNILLSYQGEVKLTDFGIARASHKALETQAGVIKGRYDYMSPEQAAGSKDLDQRSDLFSVGVVLYEMLTGKHPFRAESEVSTLERVRAGKYRPVSSINPDVPFSLEAVVDRALRTDRNERYPTATAFKEALDRFFHDSGFIFTHATLEAYVKGLFPNRSRRGGSAPPPSPPPRLISMDDEASTEDKREDFFIDEGSPDDPTRLDDRNNFLPLTPDVRQIPQDFSESQPDDPTLIRRSPLDWDQQQETLVQRAPDLGETIDRAVERSQSMQRTRRRASNVASALMGVLLMMFGFILGGLSTAVAIQVLGGQPSATQSQLQVEAPTGALIRVNGQPAFGPLQVAPNIKHTIEVEAMGYEAWKGDVSLVPGELRVVTIELYRVEEEH